MMTKKKLRARIAELEDDLATHREVRKMLVAYNTERKAEHDQLISQRDSAWKGLQWHADRLVAIEAQAGHWSTSSNSVYRKCAREITQLLQQPAADDAAVA